MPRLFITHRDREIYLCCNKCKDEEADQKEEMGTSVCCPTNQNQKPSVQREQRDLCLQWIDSILYVAGATLLVVGSVFFLPTLQDESYFIAGLFCFMVASAFYFIVSVHDVLEGIQVNFAQRKETAKTNNNEYDKNSEDDSSDQEQQEQQQQRQKLLYQYQDPILLLYIFLKTSARQEFLVSFCYACGAAMFLVGSILYLPEDFITESTLSSATSEQQIAAAKAYVAGSLFFVLGALFQVVEIWNAPDKYSTQLANLVGILYMMGSIFYVCASTPYNHTFENEDDSEWVFTISSIGFIIGSSMFWLAGILDMRRLAYVRGKRTEEREQRSPPEQEEQQQQKEKKEEEDR